MLYENIFSKTIQIKDVKVIVFRGQKPEWRNDNVLYWVLFFMENDQL